MKQKLLLAPVFLLMIVASLRTMAQLKPVSSISLTNIPLLKGANTFSTAFNATATSRSDVNAYLLCYITTLIYPQYLSVVANNSTDAYIDHLHNDDPFFANEYQKYTAFLFTSPQYQFLNESFPTGYDPEAMLISTPQTIYVVFRGTDRVSSNQPHTFMYDWGEWLTTDFDARYLTTPELTGQVHAGMWLSLMYNNFKDKLLQAIIDKGGKTKKVWICGHSLGSGQAQLFAMFMAKKGIVPQGVYAYAAPHPGTQEFVDEINRLLPAGRLQRFDFVSDPVTTLAPYILGYRRAGVRVYYNDIKTIQFGAPERSPLDGLNLFPGLSGATANAIADMVNGKANSKFKLDVITPGGSPMCYHHPLWYLRAAYNQLSPAERETVPAPLPTPDPNLEGCDLITVQRGKSSNPLVVFGNVSSSLLDGGAALVKAGIDELTFTATTTIGNVTGSAISEGNYYIKSYPAEKAIGINEVDGKVNGGRINLATDRSLVKIERYGAIGYTISFGTKQVQGFFGPETKTYVLDSKAEDLFDDGASTIQVWEKNSLPALSANQRWLFINIKDNKYIIKNLANGKSLDADNGCINNNSCGVKTLNSISNDQTQIWVLEKIN